MQVNDSTEAPQQSLVTTIWQRVKNEWQTHPYALFVATLPLVGLLGTVFIRSLHAIAPVVAMSALSMVLLGLLQQTWRARLGLVVPVQGDAVTRAQLYLEKTTCGIVCIVAAIAISMPWSLVDARVHTARTWLAEQNAALNRVIEPKQEELMSTEAWVAQSTRDLIEFEAKLDSVTQSLRFIHISRWCLSIWLLGLGGTQLLVVAFWAIPRLVVLYDAHEHRGERGPPN